jgi:hypothetical protein
MAIVLNGTTGITNDGGYTGDGVVFADTTPANTLVTTTGGNVGIGVSSPGVKLDVRALSGGVMFNVQESDSGNSRRVRISNSGTVNTIESTTGVGSTQLAFAVDGPERMRIDSSGNLLVGVTTPAQTVSTNNVLTLKSAGTAAVWGVGPTTSFGNFYISTSGTGVSLAGGATSWGTVSDERHKDIIEPIADAVNKVANIRAVIGKYKTDESGTRRSFLIAQDVQAVLPEAVDSTDSENLALRYSEVTPLLVAAIQEQQAIITALTARVEALEGTQP